jgi:CRISPR-associated protein Cas2
VLVLITYDVATDSSAGRKRLRRVAKQCENYGQRVQNSVFECLVDPAQFAELKAKLLEEVDTEEDSLRFYFLGAEWKRRVEHHGTKAAYDPEGPMII